jgi:two-component system sensor histidine kinase/response regulator
MARRLLRWERMPAAETASPSKTILLVEDDPGVRFATTAFLEDEGFSVIPASTGADALLILRHMDPPDLIVLDLMLPLMSGWDVSAELAKDERLARVPVIILSGVADTREAALLRVQPENCVKKPVPPDKLLAAVRRCLALETNL